MRGMQSALNSSAPSTETAKLGRDPARDPKHRPSISCVMPAFNEALGLPAVARAVLAALKALSPQAELIIVDDGSRDATAQVAAQLCAELPELVLLQLSRNFGKEAALTAGIEAARGEVIILIDADGQHPTALLAKMLEKWRAGADVVYAVRTERSDQTALHRAMAKSFYRLVNWNNHFDIPPDAGDFRLMDRKVVTALLSLPERNRFMKGLYAWVGFVSTAIEYAPLVRAEGKSKFGLRRAFSLALTGMLAFSTVPLRAVSFLGLFISLASLAYGGVVIAEYFLSGTAPPGYATIVVGIMFLSGVQLLCTGILAEYIGRIYDEVKQRPTYVLMHRQGKGLGQ